MRNGKIIFTFAWNHTHTCARTHKKTETKADKARLNKLTTVGIVISDFKLYYETIVLKISGTGIKIDIN